ncbi:unnamed protein product, partial [Brenthis ino]
MHRSIVLLFLCSIVLIEFSNSYLIKARTFDSVSTRDIPASPSQDVIENKLGEPEVVPEVLASTHCAKVGEFCMNHKDCCSNACLGYMKRCVSS